MKTRTLFSFVFLFASVLFAVPAYAAPTSGGSADYSSGMMGGYYYAGNAADAGTTTESDGAGAALWQKLQSGALSCGTLTDSDFAALGDYFMSSMMGSAHDAMDARMTYALGSQGDEQMHIALGERFSGCNASAAYPAGGTNFLPAMMGGWGMMGNHGFSDSASGYPMFYGGSAPWWSELLTITFAAFALLGIVTALRWLLGLRK